MDLPYALLVGSTGVVAGAIASVAGFGIGSLLTPVLALQLGAKLAVAGTSVPHAIGTLQRFWMLRANVDRHALVSFGIASALGGLAGALLQARASSPALAIAFGAIVMLAGISQLTGWIERIRWGRRGAWAAGLISGALGGLVGNQGGIRAAALLGFDVPRQAFVATATAIALIVDAVRLPVYLATQGAEIASAWPSLAIATLGVIVGTAIGTRILGRLPEVLFRRVVAVVLILLGLSMLISGGAAG